MESTAEALVAQLDHHAARAVQLWHGRRHYAYQARIRRAVISAVVYSRLLMRTMVVPIELPRQSGKTSAVVDTNEFLLTAHLRYLGAPLSLGIFAPQREQATTDFDRLRTQYGDIASLGYSTKAQSFDEHGKPSPIGMPEKWNSKAIRLYQRRGQYLGEAYIFPISKTSRSESKTFGLINVEECQDVDDYLLKNSVFPMGAATNAPRIPIGTAGTRNCYFKSQLDTNPLAIRISLDEVLRDRRSMYDLTGDERHLAYEHFVKAEIAEHGISSDYIRRQYLCEWLIGTGNFITTEQWNGLLGSGKLDADGYVVEEWLPTDEFFFGLDTAKHPDRTVCIVLRGPRKPGEKARLAGILSLQGTDYPTQFERLEHWLKRFPNIVMGAIDSTGGSGDFMPDMFDTKTDWQVIHYTFSAVSKDALYKNLEAVIHQQLTEIPADDGSEDWRRMRKEMLELEREYKGRLLSVHHPEHDAEGRMGHDDYPDAWALAEWAQAETARSAPRMSFG